jgi:hypothetical protein
VISARYNVVQGGLSSTATQVQTYQGTAVFQGQNAIRVTVQETRQATGVPDVLYAGTNYVTLANNAAVMLLGTVASFDQSGTTWSQTLALSPAQPDLDFALAAGAARSSSSSVSVSFSPAAPTPTTFTAASTLTFAGFETVTVPAGTFANACKFVLDLTASSNQTTTRWIARGSGVMLRSVSGTTTQELVSATLDGNAVSQ